MYVSIVGRMSGVFFVHQLSVVCLLPECCVFVILALCVCCLSIVRLLFVRCVLPERCVYVK